MKYMTIEKRKKISQLIIARLNGRDIKRKLKYYRSLVKQGIGGFIIFGGELREVREGIEKLQASAEIPLFIASDLEQGLGQQINGGTLIPPAMAVAKSINRKRREDISLLRKAVDIISGEIKAAGINVIFAPVLDVITNPENPIICTRAFSEDPEEVAWFGKEFIKGIQRQGIMACAKHFPGHGDTERDSHKELPVIKADMKRLWKIELFPFIHAIKAGVGMVMVGHLKVPALDRRFPSSLSKKTIQGLLRGRMNFKGLVITDAMNMNAVSGSNPESGGKACLSALKAGADIILHPEDPERVIDYLYSRWNRVMPRVNESYRKILKAKKRMNIVCSRPLTIKRIGIRSHWQTARQLTKRSITADIGPAGLKDTPVVLVFDDDNSRAGSSFIKVIKNRYPEAKTLYIDNRYRGKTKTVLDLISDRVLLAAVFSRISAWKGRNGLSRKLMNILEKAVAASKYSVLAGFCCPYILRDLKADNVIDSYSGSETAQEETAKIICGL